MRSIWKQNVMIKAHKGLEYNASVNVVVIGAGMAGILTAYLLQKKGIEVLLLESKRIAGGQTQNTTAKITSQHGLFYSNMIGKTGRKRMRAYAEANESAIEAFAKIIKEEKIECDFKRLPSFLYTTHPSNCKRLQLEAEVTKSLGIKSVYYDGEKIKELPFEVSGAVCFENQAQFHPLKFINHLAKDLIIYENTQVTSVKGHTVYTNNARIEADYIVFATHYPFINVPGIYFMRQHQERSYVLALRQNKSAGTRIPSDSFMGGLSAMYYSMDEKGLSFRMQDDVLLLGGGAHRTGKKTGCKNEDVGYSFLRKEKDKFLPETEVEAAWSAQDCMPHDNIPFIGKYSYLRPYWYVATGFKKWGMTASMIAAEIISDSIYRSINGCESEKARKSAGTDMVGKTLDWAFAFKPQRLLLRASFVKFLLDVCESVIGLCKGVFCRGMKKCPHMGCKLEWNDEEKSWDCPCHGSRFTNEGEIKDNPAQTDMCI